VATAPATGAPSVAVAPTTNTSPQRQSGGGRGSGGATKREAGKGTPFDSSG
jgi:hypothetical protein